MNHPILSILTPAVWSRLAAVNYLRQEVEKQTKAAGLEGLVQHCVLFDNRVCTIGHKRQALVDGCQGQYFAFVDDDDKIRPGYVARLVEATAGGPDVITFRQLAVINDQEGEIEFRAGCPDEPWRAGGTARRGPWHVCAWRAETVRGCKFETTNYGEDIAWARQARRRIRFAEHIDAVLHEYHHHEKKTLAPMPG